MDNSFDLSKYMSNGIKKTVVFYVDKYLTL